MKYNDVYTISSELVDRAITDMRDVIERADPWPELGNPDMVNEDVLTAMAYLEMILLGLVTLEDISTEDTMQAASKIRIVAMTMYKLGRMSINEESDNGQI